MLRITLYQRCCLTNQYKEVFSVGPDENGSLVSTLNNYLNNLPHTTIEVDYVYQENEGTLIFSADLLGAPYDIYIFNYMKVETLEDESIVFERYCFVDNITIKNEVVLLDYSEDIWHSYAFYITGISKSYLINSRIIDYRTTNVSTLKLSPYTLPVKFDGNNPIEMQGLFPSSSDLKLYNVVVEIQNYLVGAQGEITTRQSNMYLLSEITQFAPNYNIDLTFNKAYQLLMGIIKSAALQNSFEIAALSSLLFNFEIGKIYLFPKTFNFNLVGTQGFPIYIKDEQSARSARLIEINNNEEITYANPVTIYDVKAISVGTLSSQFDVVYNGTSLDVKLGYNKSFANFSIYINLNNNIYEISDDFSIEMPIKQLASEELSLLRLQREIKIANLKDEKAASVQRQRYNTIAGIGRAVQSSTIAASKFNIVGALGGVFADVAETQAKNITETYNRRIASRNITLENAPYYSSTQGVIINSSAFANAIYGLVLFKINSENDNYVRNCIKEFGFNTYQFIDNLSSILIHNSIRVKELGYNTNFIRLSNVTVFGKFSQNIANKLQEILEAGIKIWYTNTRTEDTHSDY